MFKVIQSCMSPLFGFEFLCILIMGVNCVVRILFEKNLNVRAFRQSIRTTNEKQMFEMMILLQLTCFMTQIRRFGLKSKNFPVQFQKIPTKSSIESDFFLLKSTEFILWLKINWIYSKRPPMKSHTFNKWLAIITNDDGRIWEKKNNRIWNVEMDKKAVFPICPLNVKRTRLQK